MPKDIFTELTAYLQRIERDVAALETARDFAMPAYNLSASPPQEPVEAQWAINKADGKPWYYYDGAWHECVCGVPTLSTSMMFVRYPTGDANYSDLYFHEGPPATGFPTPITNVDQEEGPELYDPYWLDSEHSELMYFSYVNLGLRTWKKMNPDGSNDVALFEPPNLSTHWAMEYFIGDVPHVVLQNTNTNVISIHNILTGAEISSFDATPIAASVGRDRISTPHGALSYDGTKLCVLLWKSTSSVEKYRLYVMDAADGGNLQLLDIPFADNGGDSIVAGWFADGTRLFCRAPATVGNPYRNIEEVLAIDVDGTNQELVFEAVGGLGSSLQSVRTSPSGTKMGCMEYNSTTGSMWFHAWDANTYDVLYSYEHPLGGGNTPGWDWSPTEEQIVTLHAKSPNTGSNVRILDLPSGTFSLLYTEEYDTNGYTADFNWSARRRTNK